MAAWYGLFYHLFIVTSHLFLDHILFCLLCIICTSSVLETREERKRTTIGEGSLKNRRTIPTQEKEEIQGLIQH
jgi:hypothetical protein